MSGYSVYQNNNLIASPTGTTYAVIGLSSGTQYSFTVAARDSYGSSSSSSAVSVTTLSSGTPPGTYTITVTGASPGTPADSGQSTQVTLVVH